MTPARKPTEPAKFEFACLRCDRPIRAPAAWAGREIRCPRCGSIQRVPEAPAAADGESPKGQLPNLLPRRYFNFVCVRCKSILEAHTGMCGQSGRCPTCDAVFTIPGVDPITGVPLGQADPGGETQNPTPVHAYAASGELAPTIISGENGESLIACGRCGHHNPIDADNCRGCGGPFTIEGAATVSAWSADAQGTAACIIGVVSIVGAILIVPGLAAVLLGWLSLNDAPNGPRARVAVAGIVLGALSLPLGAWMIWRVFF